MRSVRFCARSLLGFVERRLVNRQRDPVRDELEQSRVVLVEPSQLERTDMHDSDHLALDDKGDRDHGPDSFETHDRTDQVDLVEVGHDERSPGHGDSARHAVAERDRRRALKLLVETDRRAHIQRLALRVGPGRRLRPSRRWLRRRASRARPSPPGP